MKPLLAVGFWVGALFGLAGAPAQAAAPAEIVFGVDATYPPFESIAPSGKMVGFDIDLATAICDNLKARCTFLSQPFSSIIPALQARKFDAILSSMNKTAEREKSIAFSSLMYTLPTGLVARKQSGLRMTVASLKGKMVGVEIGSAQEGYANTYWKPNGVHVVSYMTQDQVYSDLILGRLDASLQDSVQADYGFLRTPTGKPFALVGTISDDPHHVISAFTGIGLRKDEPELLARINAAIAAIHADGTYDRLQAKYFTIDIYQPPRVGTDRMTLRRH